MRKVQKKQWILLKTYKIMENNNLTVRKGQCINFGMCSKADTKEVQEVNPGNDFICSNPECEQILIEVKPTTWWEKNKKWLFSFIVVLVLGGAGYGIYWLINRPKPEIIVFINPENATIKVDETVKLTVKTDPEEAAKKMKWNWESSDEKIATVSRSGVVTGTSEGRATITITADKKPNISTTASVTVTPKESEITSVSVESVCLDQSSLSLKVGDNSVTLNPTVSPDNAPNKDVVWSSSNETVAKVDNGKITALKKGTTDITAKSVDGSEKSAVCKVTVTDGGTIPPPKYKCGDYEGKTSNGKANGLGTFTYKSRTLIDDLKMVYAEQGDYITGTFRDDRIVSVQLFDSRGNLKQTVIPQQPTSICR